MKKIPTLFQRTPNSPYVVDELTPGCEWVAAGEGVPTQKLDGTACLIREGKLYKRRELKSSEYGFEPPTAEFPHGRIQAPPEMGFELEDYDPRTGKAFGWIPVGDGPEDQWHREAFDVTMTHQLQDGTYELVGPKIQGNPEGFSSHALFDHRKLLLTGKGGPSTRIPPRDFEGLRDYFNGRDVEGVVWHHPDGRMAKIKGKDFGIRRPVGAAGGLSRI